MSGSQSFGSGERFYHSLCPVTLRGEGLVPCAQCAMVRYSSIEAAAQHWPSHSPLCRLLVKLTAAAGGKNPLDKNPGACLQLASIAKMCLRRSLTQFESDVLMYPRSCTTCSTHLPSIGLVCTACGCSVYCDIDCQQADTKHKDLCKLLGKNRLDFVYWRERNLKVEVENVLILTAMQKVETMADAIRQLAPNMTLDDPQGRAVSSVISSPLTCLTALPFTTPATPLTLTVHLVGSRQIEISSLSAWSLLQVDRLVLVFIGPECSGPQQPLPPSENVEYQFVPPCTYADFATSTLYTEPDIVCAFNCGFILYSSWAESIPHMVRRSGAPLVFTEYYMQDCQANLDMVQELVPVQVLQEPMLNPFRSFMSERSPVAMWGREAGKLGRGDVVSDNAHVVVLRQAGASPHKQ